MVQFFGGDGFDSEDDEDEDSVAEVVDMDAIQPLDEDETPPKEPENNTPNATENENLEELSSNVLTPVEEAVTSEGEEAAPLEEAAEVAAVEDVPAEDAPLEDEAEVTEDDAVPESKETDNSNFLEEKAQTNQAMYEMGTVAELVKALTDSKVIEAPAVVMIGGLSAQYLKFEPKNDIFGFLQNLEDLERLEQFKTFTVDASWTHVNLPNAVSKQKMNGTLEDRYDDLMKSKDDAEGVVKTWLTNKTVFDSDSQPSMVYQTMVAGNTPCLDLKLTEHEPGSGFIVVMNAAKLGDAFNFMKCKALGSTDPAKSVYLGNILKIIAKVVTQVTVVNVATVSKDKMEAVVGSPPSDNNTDTENDIEASLASPSTEDADVPVVEDSEVNAGEDADNSAVEDADVPAGEDADVPAVEDADVPAVEDADVPAVEDADVPAVEDADVPAVEDADVPAVEGSDVNTGESPVDAAIDSSPADTSSAEVVAPFSSESIDEPAKGGKRNKTRTKKLNLKMKVTRVKKP